MSEQLPFNPEESDDSSNVRRMQRLANEFDPRPEWIFKEGLSAEEALERLSLMFDSDKKEKDGTD